MFRLWPSAGVAIARRSSLSSLGVPSSPVDASHTKRKPLDQSSTGVLGAWCAVIRVDSCLCDRLRCGFLKSQTQLAPNAGVVRNLLDLGSSVPQAAAWYPRGMAASSFWVYSCFGCARISWALACSTTTPSFITSTSSLMKRTTARSWLMKT